MIVIAINVKNLLATALLELCETQSLESMTIKQLLDKTGISRQTFYNHFIDKNDLIQDVYDTRIVWDFNDKNISMNFYDSLLIAFENMKNIIVLWNKHLW